MLEKVNVGARNCLGYKASGKLTTDELQTVAPEMNRAIEENGRICLFLEMEDYRSMSGGSLIEDAQLVPKMKDVEKVAVVGDSKTQKTIADLANVIGNISKTEVKYFTTDRRKEAIDWVKKPAMKPRKQ